MPTIFWELQLGLELSTSSALVQIMRAIGLKLLKRREGREREERIRQDETLSAGMEEVSN